MSGEDSYIALFRGVNVGGHNKVKMAELAAMFEGIGLADARTYVQSGNVVFRAQDAGEEALAERIRGGFSERFGFSPAVMVRGRAAWRALMENNPFPEAAEQPTTLHAFVMEVVPEDADLARLDERAAALAGAEGEDRYAVVGQVLYLYTPNGLGRSKLADIVMRTLKVPMTARNWRTVLALWEMAGGA